MSVIYLLIHSGTMKIFLLNVNLKKAKKRVTVKLNRRNEKVESGSSTCWKQYLLQPCSGFTFEIADYSLHQLSRVPEEISWASRLRQLEGGRVPSEKYTPKSPGYYANCREKTTNKTRDIKYSLWPSKNTSSFRRKIK